MPTPRSEFMGFCEQYPNVIIERSIDRKWYPLLNEVFAENLEVLDHLNDFLQNCREPINPAKNYIWGFTKFCEPSKVKVVIMGQDPYAGKYLKNSKGFSVDGRKRYIPPSLKIILDEVRRDILNSNYAHMLRGYPPRRGCLKNWGREGVLLLDSALTVTQEQPGSHIGKGWEEIVGSILIKLQTHHRNDDKALVFMLWGNSAKKMKKFLNQPGKKLVLEAHHPSTMNENNPFGGCRHFSKANDFFIAKGEQSIDWSLL